MRKSIIIILAAVAFASCADKWQLSGKIDGAADETVYVQNSSNGLWIILDSARTDSEGNFAISHAPAGHPDIYRLVYGENVVYFPIDSVEAITLSASKANFTGDYAFAGSPDAEAFMKIDHKIYDTVGKTDAATAANDSLLKRDLSEIILADPAGLAAYYIITRQISGNQIFRSDNRRDLGIIGAVANAFSEQRPDDPRTEYLKQLYLSNKKALSAGKVVYADEAPLIEINLRDEKGKEQSLTELASKGNVVVLNFTTYDAPESPAFNVALNKAYERFHAQGLEIYQVAVDVDDVTWRQSAVNLPWITVRNPQADGAKNLLNYNVQEIPATFLINRKGELVKRLDNIDSLQAEIAKLM
ncbi:MAG: AhpC/TSA family protein [Salinivirgaceae bacterium]|nr:AhpC/TSA family protein [Salinivirgaceae bacterium]MBQ4292560.1 AhpC/TSA family protein [Muribaculaceae bacterium]MBQ7211193.1 AhpC/TSA family protein [Muribaculaceae bacterium]